MATGLTHLRIAEKIKEMIKGINEAYLILGLVAPEIGAEGAGESRKAELFYRKYLVPEKIIVRSDKTRSFLWGYYFQLLTNQLWEEQYIQPIANKAKTDDEKQEIIQQIQEDLMLLDIRYLADNGCKLIEKLKAANMGIYISNEFSALEINNKKAELVELYGAELKAPEKDPKHFESITIEQFVSKTAGRCIKVLV